MIQTLFAIETSMPGGIAGLLIQFLVICIVLLIVAGLLWVIETYIMKQPIPTMIKLVIGLVLVVLVIIWAVRSMGG